MPIAFGQTSPGQLTAQGDFQLYALTVGAEHVGREVSVVVTPPPDPFGPILELFAPNGTRLAVNSTSRAFGANAVELDDVFLPVEGVYLIRVRDSGDDEAPQLDLNLAA